MVAWIAGLIAMLGVLIAYFQWLTAHQRIIMDLFEERVGVINEIEESIRLGLDEESKGRQRAFYRFVMAERRARFLFGEDVLIALKELREAFAAINALGPGSPPHVAGSEKLTDFLAADGTQLFAPYVRMDQTMPSLWRPF